MHESLAALLAATASLYCVQSAQWSASLPEDTFVYACAGDSDFTFRWEMDLEPDEKISCVEWFYSQDSQQQTTAASPKGLSERKHSGSEQSLIAMFSHGLFLPTPTFSQRLQQEGILGLKLSHVTEGDSGKYSVEAMVIKGTSEVATKFLHTLTLVVYSEDSARRDASVTVRQMTTAVWNEETDQLHVQLTCTGNGREPPAVIFTLPSGENKVVSTAENGHFPLLVPNPVSGGNYTCRVHDDTPAAQCLSSGSPGLTGHLVHVDKTDARIILLEAELRRIKENDTLTSRMQILEDENRELKNELNGVVSKRVAFYSRISASTGSLKLSTGVRLVLDNAVYNQGGGYSPSTGVFTAPYDGTYAFFAFIIPTSSSSESEVKIILDGTEINWCESHIGGDAHSCSAVLHIKAGQTAWLACDDTRSFFYQGTSFSGFLVSPDP